jgi:hypothetical protein
MAPHRSPKQSPNPASEKHPRKTVAPLVWCTLPCFPLYGLLVPHNPIASQHVQAIFIAIKINMRFVFYITAQNKKE